MDMQTQGARVAELAEKFKAGDTTAFDGLYEQTKKYVCYIVRQQGVPESETEDVVQDVFISVYNDIGQLDNPDAALGWIKRKAFGKSVDYMRKNGKAYYALPSDDTSVIGEDVADEGLLLPEDVFANEERQKFVRSILNNLPETQRECMMAYYFGECKVNEIAEMMEIPANTVKTNLSRARAALKNEVLAEEKRSGVRLHSFAGATVLLFLYSLDAEASFGVAATASATSGAAAVGAKTVMTQVTAETKMATVQTANYGVQTGVAASAKTGTAAGVHTASYATVGKVTGISLAKKVAVAVAITTIGGAAVVTPMAVRQLHKEEPEQVVEADVQEIEEIVEPMAEPTAEDLALTNYLEGKEFIGERTDSYTGYIVTSGDHPEFSFQAVNPEGTLTYFVDDFDNDGEDELLEINIKSRNKEDGEEKEYYASAAMYEKEGDHYEKVAEKDRYTNSLYNRPFDVIHPGLESENGRFICAVYPYQGVKYVALDFISGWALLGDGIGEALGLLSYNGTDFTEEIYYEDAASGIVEGPISGEYAALFTKYGLPVNAGIYYNGGLVFDEVQDKIVFGSVTTSVKDDVFDNIDFGEIYGGEVDNVPISDITFSMGEVRREQR